MSHDLLDRLTAPGHLAVFADDSDLDEAPGFVPNVRVLMAVATTSERYDLATRAMAAELDRLGVPEFHAAEIVNPKSGSPWSTLCESERVNALAFVAKQLNELDADFGYNFCSRSEYARLAKEARRHGKVGVGFHHGLKRVFLRSVLERLENPEYTTVVIDQDRPQNAPRLDLSEPAPELVCGGVVAAPSHLCAGLQLADLAAWSMTRFARVRTHFGSGKQSRFDEIAASVLGNNHERFQHMLPWLSEAA